MPFFSKQILTKQNTASTKYSQEFLASQVPVLRRNKAITPVLQTIHFSASILGELFKLFGFAITFSREVCHLDIQRKKKTTIVLVFSLETLRSHNATATRTSKNNRFSKQNNKFAHASRFFTFLCRFCTTTTWNCLILLFRENVNKQWWNFILL